MGSFIFCNIDIELYCSDRETRLLVLKKSDA